MKCKIYKGGVDNYPLWWYGQKSRLTNFGDRPNFFIPHGAVFKGKGYYFNSANSDYMEDIYGRHLISESTNGLWSQLYLTNSAVPPCGSVVGTGDKFYLSQGQVPKITGKLIAYPEYCPNISYFICYNNSISILDISRLISLVYVVCAVNFISVLDISKLILLNILKCYNNKISALDISNNSLISYLDCHSNFMGQGAVDKVLCDANAWNTSNGTLDISGNTAPSQTGIDAKNDMVNNRGWTVTTD